MVFLTASAIGLCAFLLRSPLAYVVVATLIAFCFAAAWLTAVGTLSPVSLLVAYAGYNAGMGLGFVTLLLLEVKAGIRRSSN